MTFKVPHHPDHPMILYRNQALFYVTNKVIPGSTVFVCCNLFKSWCRSQHRPAAETATNTQLKHWLNIFPLPCLQRVSVSLLMWESPKEHLSGSTQPEIQELVLCWRIIGLLFTQVYQGLFQDARSFTILLASVLLLTHSSRQLISVGEQKAPSVYIHTSEEKIDKGKVWTLFDHYVFPTSILSTLILSQSSCISSINMPLWLIQNKGK